MMFDGLFLADSDDDWRQEQRHWCWESSQPAGGRLWGGATREVSEVVEEDDGQGELETVRQDVDQDRGQRHHPAPASLGIVVLLQSLEIPQLLIEVSDDDWLTTRRQDHLHVRLGLHLSLNIKTCAASARWFWWLHATGALEGGIVLLDVAAAVGEVVISLYPTVFEPAGAVLTDVAVLLLQLQPLQVHMGQGFWSN